MVAWNVIVSFHDVVPRVFGQTGEDASISLTHYPGMLVDMVAHLATYAGQATETWPPMKSH